MRHKQGDVRPKDFGAENREPKSVVFRFAHAAFGSARRAMPTVLRGTYAFFHNLLLYSCHVSGHFRSRGRMAGKGWEQGV